MVVSQGILKKTVVGAQSGLGTPKTGSGGQVLRRTSSVFTLDKDTFTSDEIVAHQQSTGVGFGIDKVTGKLEGLMSAGTYAALFANLLRADFAATSAISSLALTIGGTPGAYTLTRGSGSWLADGVKSGDVVRITAGTYTGTARDINLLVIAVTSATVLTCAVLNGSTLTTQGPVSSSTLTVIGKKSKPPLTGHTNTYLTFEEWYADGPFSESFNDCKIGKAEVGLPSSGNSTVSFDIVGLSRTTSTSQQMTSPTAETTTGVLTGSTGVVYVNGVAQGIATGASVTIDGMIKAGDAVIGSSNAPDLDRGRISVTGSFSAFFNSTVIRDLYAAETPISLVMVMAADNTATSDFVAITLGRIKLTGDAPDDGEKQIIRTYPFTAELNSAGGAALAWDQTIITIQDSQAP